jgi:hypothetical protein
MDIMQQMLGLIHANHVAQARMEVKMDANLVNTAEMKAKMNTYHNRMVTKLNIYQEWTMAHPGATEIEPDPRMMQSIKKHQEVLKGQAAVMLVGGSGIRSRMRPRSAANKGRKGAVNCGTFK